MSQTYFAAVFFIIFCAMMIGIGLYYSGKDACSSSDDYILAGRNAPLILVVGSYFATSVSTGSLVGYAGMGFSNGLAGYWSAGCFMVATMWAGIWIVPRLRRSGVTTIPELFGKYFGPQHRITAVILCLCRDLGVIASTVLVLSQIFINLFGMNLWLATLITSGVIIIFTVSGGMWAVLVTDTIQAIIIALGTIIMVPLGIKAIGGFDAFVVQIPTTHNNVFSVGLTQTLGWFMIGLFTSLANQTILQRGLAAKDDRTAKLAFFWGGLVTLFWFLLPFIIGIIARVLFPYSVASNSYYDMSALFGPYGDVFFMAVLLMAGMSTVSSNILTATSNISLDIYKRFINPKVGEKKMVTIQRILLVVILMACIVIRHAFPYVVELFWIGGRIMASGLAPVLTLMILWKRVRCAPLACLSAMLSGALSCIGAQIYQGAQATGTAGAGGVVLLWSLDPVLAGLPVCFIVLLIGVWLETRNQTPELLQRYLVKST